MEKYIDLMIQSDRYLTDKEKEHYTPPVPITVEPDATLTHAKNLIRDFCQEEYDSEPDFSDLSKIGVAYTNATDEEIPIQVNVDLVGYRMERYLGDILVDERQYESLEDLTENSGQKRLPKNMHRTVPVDVRTPIWTEAVVGSTTTARG